MLEYLSINVQLDPARSSCARRAIGGILQIRFNTRTREPMNAPARLRIRAFEVAPRAVSSHLMARPFSLNYDGSVHPENSIPSSCSSSPLVVFRPGGSSSSSNYIYTSPARLGASHLRSYLTCCVRKKNSYLEICTATLKSRNSEPIPSVHGAKSVCTYNLLVSRLSAASRVTIRYTVA